MCVILWEVGEIKQIKNNSSCSVLPPVTQLVFLFGFPQNIWAFSHLARRVCEGANTEIHSRADAVYVGERFFEADRVSFFLLRASEAEAAPRGPVGYNMLVPRRETGTDWKTHTHTHRRGHPHVNHPGPRAAALLHEGGG